MFNRLRDRITYANVVATLALFVALGGGAYAASKLTGKHIKNESLTGRDIRDKSVTAKDVARLGRANLKAGAVTGRSSVVQTDVTVDTDGVALGEAECPDGELTGGGWTNEAAGGTVRRSAPFGRTWTVYVIDATPGAQFSVYAVCLE